MSSLTFILATSNHMFFTLPKLQLFEIGGNQMSGLIPSSITNATLLQRFDITDNSFFGGVPSLAKLQDLWWLNLGLNYLGSNSAKDSEFLESLQNCSKLEILSIAYNNFRGHLPENIGNFSTLLREVYLGDNLLSGKIPVTLANLINLDLFSMEFNYFTGTIPTSFLKFQSIETLDLSYNQLSGEIPAIVGNLSHLLELRMSDNMLEGNIPPSIGNCHNLEILDLGNNNLSGMIPSQVISLSSLTILLNLSENSLTGSLSEQVGRLKFILQLDVSKNHLSGYIPEAIGGLINLEYLNLQGNSFNGTIPSSLALVKSLQHLDLSSNNLSGSIPVALEDMSSLEYLNLSFNKLDGEVPTKGVFKNATAIAVIGNSKLCGGISKLQLPPCQGSKYQKHHNFKLISVIGSMVAFLLLLSSVFALYKMRKRKNEPFSNSVSVDQLEMVSYQNLHQATNGFSANNLIGSGHFCSVYKGSLDSTDKAVAIKVLNLQKKGAHRSFIAEYYKGQEFKALVFKYMENGSLDKWLHPDSESVDVPQTLSLNQRIRILIDVASAMHYLHYECEQPVIHCDIKPSNILLDNDMVAHVGDFGLARILSTINGTTYEQNTTSGIKGTIGYTPPVISSKVLTKLEHIAEYGMGSEASKQGNVYSFGILILEMLTARRPIEETFEDGQNLHSYVKMGLTDKMFQMVDPVILYAEINGTREAENSMGNLTLKRSNADKCLQSLFKIGLACSVEPPKERMSMEDVLIELNLIKNSFKID
ncbi:hypothetical protein PIB30_042934 [Stylosanthes scabra]|uniref:Protein kinase domain-containing protein n=1 Tax=Stylosanthes scabra TaxID=79078 RepID=A0ABU6XGN6_9FABA|nr:hypothetical protein [Stylosanthes scabra]